MLNEVAKAGTLTFCNNKTLSNEIARNVAYSTMEMKLGPISESQCGSGK